MPPLSPAEIAAVAQVLVKAFREEYQLEKLAATAVDLDFVAYIGRGRPMFDAAQRVAQWTEGEGSTELLLREALFQRPHNLAIQQLAQRYGLAPPPLANVRMAAAPAAVSGMPAAPPIIETPADLGAYEAMVLRLSGTVKPGAWRRQMAEREWPICQILCRGDAIGTGFLVSSNRVMSNWHVFEDPAARGTLGAPGDYSVRFDHRATEGQAPASNGSIVAIEAAKGYLASSDKTAFDYVLVELTQHAGEHTVDSAGHRRGWLKPSTRVMKNLEPLLVLQHPKGRTLELAIGPVTGSVANRKDEIYEHWANTDEGSSGSPCFSAQWELTALHHRADPQGGARPNRAVAMTAVLADMGAHNTLALLPPLD